MGANQRLYAAAIGLVVCVLAPAQTLIAPDRLAAARSAFDSAGRAARLRCEIHPIQPALTYRLQFQAGYTAEVPAIQFSAPGHLLTVLLRVTPASREPVYLGTEGAVSNTTDPKSDVHIPGAFLVGEGTYSAEVLVRDDTSRVCYSQWTVQAKPAGSERELRPAVPPGAVREFRGAGTGEAQADSDSAIDRLTLLVHASAANPHGAKMEDRTIAELVDSVSALLAQLPARSVRLVLFSLARQAVLYSKDGFRATDLEDLRRACDQVQLAVVDLKTLENRARTDVLGDLVAQESNHPSSTVVLVGPRTAEQTDTTFDPDSLRAGGAPWFYLQYQRYLANNSNRPGADPSLDAPNPQVLGLGSRVSIPVIAGPGELAAPPDGIERLIRKLKGTVLGVRSPHDLAEAIHRIAGEVPASGPRTTAPPPAPTISEPARRKEDPELAEPSGDQDPVEVLALLRDRVVAHAGSVPNHTCVETVKRDYYKPPNSRSIDSCDNLLASRKRPGYHSRLDLTDWLRLDVGLADGREIFSWAGASHFEEGEIDDLIPEGAFGSGPFATMLLSIFDHRDPHFVLEGETTLDGRRVLQYSFRVPREESEYRVKERKGEWVVTGYTGSLMVDPRTSDLVRFAVRTEELPPATEMCEVDSTLDYDMVPLGGFEYLLPKVTRQRFIGMDGEEGENQVSFASCRKFLGESTLTFGNAPVRGSVDAPVGSSAILPAGLSLTAELTSEFTLGEAAAGDRIEGILAEPLRDPKTQTVLAPAGARLNGRLTRVEFTHAGAGEYTVALRWENLETEAGKLPLKLKPNRSMAGLKSVARGVLQQRGMPIELPPPSNERDAIWSFPAQTTKVESGRRTEWVTTAER